jgi:hypothetical protein
MEETLIFLCKEEEKKGVDLELPLPYIFPCRHLPRQYLPNPTVRLTQGRWSRVPVIPDVDLIVTVAQICNLEPSRCCRTSPSSSSSAAPPLRLPVAGGAS